MRHSPIIFKINFMLHSINNKTCVGEDKWKPAPYIQLKQFIWSISKCLCSLPFNFDFTWTLNQKEASCFFLILFYRLSGLIEALSIFFEFSCTMKRRSAEVLFRLKRSWRTINGSKIFNCDCMITFICNESTPTRFIAAILDLAQLL